MQQLSRRANSLAHLDSKSQSPFLVSSSLATAPPPSAQAQRRGTAPPMVATRARSPGAAGRPGPPPVAPVWVLAVSRRSSLKQMEASLTYF